MDKTSRVLLIPVHYTHNRCVPLSIAYIAAVLEKNKHFVKIYDPPPYEKYDIEAEVINFKPDIIGISCMTVTFNKAIEIAKKIKSVNNNIPLAFGGIHVTALPEESMLNKEIDYVIFGEGEYTFLDLIETLNRGDNLGDVCGLCYRDGKKIKMNKPRQLISNLDELPLPARHLFPSWYFMRWMCMRGKWLRGTNMISSRGCPYDCSYCASKVMFGRGVRFISPKKVVDEIEHLVKNYNLETVTFSDDTFSVNEKRAIEICNELKMRGVTQIKFRIQLRANTVSEDLLKNLREVGCIQVDVGVESGSQRILNVLNKGITIEQVKNAFNLFKKYKLDTCATFMIGNPTETLEDLEMTRNLAKEISADYTQFFITTPYPGTKLYNDLGMHEKQKLINFDNLHHGGIELKSYVNSKIPIEELIMMQQDLNNEFLKKTGIKMITPMLVIDTILLMLQRPSIIIDAIANFYRTKKIVEIYRTIYEGHNFRRF